MKPNALLASRAGLAGVALALPALAIAMLPLTQAHAQTVEELREMSIDDLAQVNVTSVSKTDQPLADAPASIYVVTHDDILRSGAATLPEMLRLAPNLQVYQTSPSNWVATARGQNGNLQAQNFSNKLLVLIDGRTVYTPLFSGVYWDMPDLLPDNVDRIEVISGPGAALWGSNAVNGVINVVTRSSSETSGLYADVRAGPDRQVAGARISGAAGEGLSYSLYGRLLHDEHFYTATGDSAEDGWNHYKGGFRLDWTPNDADRLSLHGDIFDGREDLTGDRRVDISGRSATLLWAHDMASAGQLQVQAFYDRIARNDQATGGGKLDRKSVV